MFGNYLKSAWRGLWRDKTSALLNLSSLAVGMATALLIGLWVADELSFDRSNKNHEYIAQVMRHSFSNHEIRIRSSVPVPLKNKLVTDYPDRFKQLILSTPDDEHVLAISNKKIMAKGRFMEPGAPDLLALKITTGSAASLRDPASVLLSQTIANRLFGETDPINQSLKIDNRMLVKVAGIYQDMPENSSFSNLMFVAPWDLFNASSEWAQKARDSWGINSYEIFALVNSGYSISGVSQLIKNVEKDLMGENGSTVFLFPMTRWHLYAEWKNGVNTGGKIEFVRLFGIIGLFVLLLACINFMNMSTARSEKRAREVGIRKAIGSRRRQLIIQFFCESLMATAIAFILALAILRLSLPFFNDLAGKQMQIPWSNPVFWLGCFAFVLVTGITAGSYPALYLSSFRPVKILKGTFHTGRYSALPRKLLVILQFTVSVVLIIGTLVVWRQVNYAKDRLVGYQRNNLISVRMTTPELKGHYGMMRAELIGTGAVLDVAESQGPATDIWDNRSGFNWPGKAPGLQEDFATVAITHDYGKTMGWQLREGRDFSRTRPSDVTSSIIINEAAVKLMGLPEPVGSTITWGGESLKIIGVVSDMIMTSPYQPVKPAVFYLNEDMVNYIMMKLNPAVNTQKAVESISGIFKQYAPGMPFNYHFVKDDYAEKFAAEDRTGHLAAIFAVLAILISCMGLFGLASYIAEQRTKEIGIRKVLGASAMGITALVTREFIRLVAIAVTLAVPIAWFAMSGWLQNFAYRTNMRWWIFAAAGLLAVIIALVTVSWQALKAARANPVKSLRTE